MTKLPFGGLLVTENATTNTWSFRNSLVFNKLFKARHSVTLQVGLELSSNTVREIRVMGICVTGERLSPLFRQLIHRHITVLHKRILFWMR